METVPKELINLIFRFLSHPVADIIKPQLNNDDRYFTEIKYAYCKYDLSRHHENEICSNDWDRNVIKIQLDTYYNLDI